MKTKKTLRETKTKRVINEGPIVRFIDRFFSSLKAGIADKFTKEAEKAGMPKEITDRMKEINDSWKSTQALLKSYKKD